MDEKIRIMKKVAENSLIYFDQVIVELKLKGYELIQEHLMKNNPEKDTDIIEVIPIIQEAINKLYNTNLEKYVKKSKKGYFTVTNKLKPSSSKEN